VLLVVAAGPPVEKKVTRYFDEVPTKHAGSHNCRPVKKTWRTAFFLDGRRVESYRLPLMRSSVAPWFSQSPTREKQFPKLTNPAEKCELLAFPALS
jgi:hypothetical protein